ncbi:triadin isoform X1 [Lucilia cuprina]|uniref:triadin isoform X1 n=1 Tax=Lucilia cuprina TaxID=7375 RepID=UPI001F0530E0|nr:triadin isoform X1 [Lucilia cuprina]
MGSLNGDVMVMRNGRSTSQVSVYNYPEHLNPFYEDDQHKRLRFWKISKKDNEGRRNSFSIGNLKDMWAFKSFRMKKKSSTLGINKTSESPPTLRRDYVVDNGWNTFDHRLRGSNTPSINGDSFQRNATYRSSLQTLPTSNDRIGLNRNDGYRSTIQVTRSNPRYQPQQKQQHTTGVSQNRRYVYGGSVTPQPLRNTRTNNIGRGPYEYECDNVMIRRSSQSSMVSTNPFESDDDDNEDINSSCMRSVNGGSTTTLTSRTPRKKRRAPAPPTPIHGRSNGAPPPTILIESSHDNTHDELRIREDIDIANLTAEIESFVKTKDNDDVEVAPKEDVQTATVTSTTKTEASTNNVEKLKVEEELEIKPAAKETSQNATSTTVISVIPTKENVMPVTKTNGQVTTEIVTVTTTTKTTTTDVNKLLEKETKVAQVSNETVIKTDDSKEIKTNGAIPKKSNNITVVSSSVEQQQQQQPKTTEVVTDLCIKETNSQEVSHKPVPLKRHTKPETEAEVGHVECIHVHVESPRATPRKEHPSGVSSFKTNENVEVNDTITTKTPFVLTSPPTPRRKPQQTESEPVIKETVKIVGTSITNERTNHDLTIKEERINAKPEILVKPTLSPKPVTKDVNGKVHGFAEIHKPVRKFTNNQNGHVRRASRDESVTPPTVPHAEEKKINNSVLSHISIKTKGEQTEEVNVPEVKKVETLKIVETSTSSTTNGQTKSVEKEETKKLKTVNLETSINNSNTVTTPELQKPADEFDLLYRPKPANHMEWKRSTLAPLETNIPPEKRKSVKDIIESINRSQRLLNAAANKDFTALQTQNTITATNNTSGPQSPTIQQTSENKQNGNGNLNENLKILDERQREIEHLVEELTEGAAANSPSPSPSNCNNEYSEAQKLDNNDIFQKCKVKKEVYDYRESSPISSNLDWNPVPKPKRTKPGHE